MEFMLWAALSLHLFAVIVWLGSLCFMSAVLYPVVEVENKSDSRLTEHIHKRLMPFLWLSLWTIGITGTFLYIFSYGVLFGAGELHVMIPVHGKIAIFIPIIIFSVRIRGLYARLGEPDGIQVIRVRNIARTVRAAILFGIISLLLAAWESVVNITS
jgi:uncharacterized membrane protein